MLSKKPDIETLKARKREIFRIKCEKKKKKKKGDEAIFFTTVWHHRSNEKIFIVFWDHLYLWIQDPVVASNAIFQYI